jgi:endonuclease/exonuclease/phosphatase family metal-dependent hydrolase
MFSEFALVYAHVLAFISAAPARVCLLLVPLLVGATGCLSSSAERRSPGFTAMTYNVFFERPDYATGERLIRDANPDILFLQEVTTGWQPTFDRLRDLYPHQCSAADTRGDGNALLSRLPLTDVRRLPPTVGWYGGWYAIAETPVGPVQILGLHLMPPLTEKEEFSFRAFLKTGRVHRREIQTFCREVDLEAPLLILGDFNESGQGAAGGWLHKQGLRCALARHDWFSPTWAWIKSPLVNGRLDHIFHTEHLHPVDSHVINDGVSDHLPVLAAFHATEHLTPAVLARLQSRLNVAYAARVPTPERESTPQSPDALRTARNGARPNAPAQDVTGPASAAVN